MLDEPVSYSDYQEALSLLLKPLGPLELAHFGLGSIPIITELFLKHTDDKVLWEHLPLYQTIQSALEKSLRQGLLPQRDEVTTWKTTLENHILGEDIDTWIDNDPLLNSWVLSLCYLLDHCLSPNDNYIYYLSIEIMNILDQVYDSPRLDTLFRHPPFQQEWLRQKQLATSLEAGRGFGR